MRRFGKERREKELLGLSKTPLDSEMLSNKKLKLNYYEECQKL